MPSIAPLLLDPSIRQIGSRSGIDQSQVGPFPPVPQAVGPTNIMDVLNVPPPDPNAAGFGLSGAEDILTRG